MSRRSYLKRPSTRKLPEKELCPGKTHSPSYSDQLVIPICNSDIGITSHDSVFCNASVRITENLKTTIAATSRGSLRKYISRERERERGYQLKLSTQNMAGHNRLSKSTSIAIVLWHILFQFFGSANLLNALHQQEQVASLIEKTQSSNEHSTSDHLLAHKEQMPDNSSTINHIQEEEEAFKLTKGLPPRDIINNAIFTRDNFESSETYFYHFDKMHGTKTIYEVGRIALMAKLQTSVYSDLFSHRYDNFDELKVSGGPGVDNELCLKQLKNLIERSIVQQRERSDSRDINLYKLLDTYGRVPPGLLIGQGSWIGAYDECVRTKIQFPDGHSSARYCWAHLRHASWPQDGLINEVSVLKSGICLPKACDSMNYKNKYDLISELITYHARDVDRGQGNLASIYCLPDEESPLRQWWLYPKSLLSVAAITSWCLLLIFCTVKSELAEKKKTEKKNLNSTNSSIVDDLSQTDQATEVAQARTENSTYLAIYRSLSITNNLKLLFNTTKQSALLEVGSKLKQGTDEQQVPEMHKIIDLSCLEGIKVICMCYVVMGHVLMCLTTTVVNGREAAETSSIIFYLANLVPAFAVNSFFTITAFLTSYLMFKQNQSHSFITSPMKWFAFIMYRYLRIMPMYLIVVLYTKHLARFVGSGPQWDYGTSELGQRRACENESWLWTLLFGANFKSPLDHCIPSAWYLANDFQFFIVTPIFLAILHKSAALGDKIIKGCICLGLFGCFMSVYLAEVDDLTPVARFMPHGFKTYVTHLYANYTQPQYRIPAYLCGLLLGFALYQFEQAKLKYLAAKREAAQRRQQQDQDDNNIHCSVNSTDLIEAEWSDACKTYGGPLSLFFILVCCSTPVIGSYLPFNKLTARIIVALIMPSYHLLFSLAVGLYILLATTGYGNKLITDLLSARFWKPLARLSLCAVLINVEVINYIIQTSSTFHYLDNRYQLSLNILCILSTYLASIVMCVLFEAPVRAALNHILAYAIKKMAPKQKAA